MAKAFAMFACYLGACVMLWGCSQATPIRPDPAIPAVKRARLPTVGIFGVTSEAHHVVYIMRPLRLVGGYIRGCQI